MRNKLKLKFGVFGLLTVLFILGGLGLERILIYFFGTITTLVIVLVLVFSRIKIRFPPNIKLYCLFLLFFLISFFWSKDAITSYEFFLLFLSAGLFWIIFYNLPSLFASETEKLFLRLVLVLGLVFGLLFLFNISLPITNEREYSLYLYSIFTKTHSHIGDFWAILIVSSSYFYLEKKKRLLNAVIVCLGIILLALSQSRSAVLSVLLGGYFILTRANLKSRIPTQVKVLGLLFLSVLVLYFGTKKSILFTRPYYLQGVMGLLKNPLGVGVGNFVYISYDLKDLIPGHSGYSYVAHNLLLEIVSGIGIFSVIFIVWLTKVLKKIIFSESKRTIIVRTIFVILMVNFMFDITYFVPTMLWLWFASLGLSQTNELI